MVGTCSWCSHLVGADELVVHCCLRLQAVPRLLRTNLVNQFPASRSRACAQVFDFGLIKKFIARSDFSLVYDALWAVTAAYARPLFVDLLGCDESMLRHAEAKVRCKGNLEC
jgi:hypothetical protein